MNIRGIRLKNRIVLSPMLTYAPMAAASRRAIFDLVLRDDLLVAGMHLHVPGFARMAQDGDGFRLLPEPWGDEL